MPIHTKFNYTVFYYIMFIKLRNSKLVPRGKGSSTLSALGEAVIDGLTSVNTSNYTDTFSCTPRVLDVVGVTPIERDDSSHFLGLISCQFTANA